MRCSDVQGVMMELADDTLSSSLKADLHAHIASCAACQRQWQAEQSWREMMLHLPTPAMRPDFGAQALARARAAHTPIRQDRHGFRTGFVTALAASVALWVGAGLWLGPQTVNTPENALPVVSVAVYQTSAIDLVFQSPDDVGVATIAMQLPANFEIAGQPGVRELTFESPIKRGNNRLVIPIQAVAPGKGEFLAKVQHMNKQKEFRVQLDARHAVQTQVKTPRILI